MTASQKREVLCRMAVGRLWLDLANEFTPLRALAELIINCLDSGATECAIGLDNKAKTIRLTDNGSGMTFDQLEAYAQAGNSLSAADVKKIGVRGTGKVATIALGQYYTLESKAKDEDMVLTFSLSVQDLKNHLLDMAFPVKIGERPLRKTDPQTGSFTTIEIQNAVKLQPRTAIKNLNAFLPRRYQCAITVNGELLAPIILIGKKVQCHEAEFPVLGEVEAEITLLHKTVAKEFRGIMLCSRRDICTLQAFYNELTDELKARFPQVLLSVGLAGWVDVPSLNKKYTVSSRDKLAADFMTQNHEDKTTDLAAFMSMLETVIAPAVQKTLDQGEQQSPGQEDEIFLQSLQEKIGFTKKPAKKSAEQEKPLVKISPAQVQMEIGTTQVFTFGPSTKNAEILWETTAGKIVPFPKNPCKCLFEPAGLGNVTISATAGNLRASAQVEVIQEKQGFCISPSKVTLEINSEPVTFKVTKASCNLKDIIWFAENSGGQINTAEGLEIEYTPGNQEGTFSLSAHDSRPDSRLEASATIILVLAKQRRTVITFNELNFEVRLTTQLPPALLFDLLVNPTDDKKITLIINKRHAAFRLPPEDRLVFLQGQMPLIYLFAKQKQRHEEDQMEDWVQQLSQIAHDYYQGLNL